MAAAVAARTIMGIVYPGSRFGEAPTYPATMAGLALMTIYWWHWLAVGLIFVALELASSGGFYIVFFGVSAIAIALLDLVGLGGPVWLQLVLFAVLAVGSLLFFRNPLLRWLKLDRPSRDVD